MIEPLTHMTSDTEAILAKLDGLAAKGIYVFDDAEIAEIKTSVAFTKAFKGNPVTLQKLSDAYEWAEGLVTVTRNVGLVIAFVVVLWANWERLFDLIRGGKP